METRVCEVCNQEKDLTKFELTGKPKKDGTRFRRYLCSACAGRARWRKLKLEAIKVLGGKCKCCRDEHWEFLAIDHVDGNGNKHRKSLGGHSITIYRDVIKHGNKDGFYQLLCHNCNSARSWFGYCPHQAQKNDPFDPSIKRIVDLTQTQS